MKVLSEFVKEKRKEANLTQEEFAERAGVALTVIRKIEQGKENLNLERVNQVLKMFGHVLAPVNSNETRCSGEEKCYPASFDWPPGDLLYQKKNR
jgi:y4mF family transcriptional regulator